MDSKTKLTSTALLAAVAMIGTGIPSAASAATALPIAAESAPQRHAPVIAMDENGMVSIAGVEANTALRTMYGIDPEGVAIAAMANNVGVCSTKNDGCNTGNCVAGCGGSFTADA